MQTLSPVLAVLFSFRFSPGLSLPFSSPGFNTRCKSRLQPEISLAMSLDVHLHRPRVPFSNVFETKVRSPSGRTAGPRLAGENNFRIPLILYTVSIPKPAEPALSEKGVLAG